MIIGLDMTKQTARQLARLCPVNNRLLFDEAWLPIVVLVREAVPEELRPKFTTACIRGSWPK